MTKENYRSNTGGGYNPDRYGRLEFGNYFYAAKKTVAFARVYDKYLGPDTHRRLPAFQALLTQLREVAGDPDVAPRNYGFDALDVSRWIDYELKAKTPRAVVKPREPEITDEDAHHNDAQEDAEDAREAAQEPAGGVGGEEAA